MEILFYAKKKQKSISGVQKAKKRSECFLYFSVKRKEAEREHVNTTTYYKQKVRRKRGMLLSDSKVLKLSKSRISRRSVTLFESQMEWRYMFSE